MSVELKSIVSTIQIYVESSTEHLAKCDDIAVANYFTGKLEAYREVLNIIEMMGELGNDKTNAVK